MKAIDITDKYLDLNSLPSLNDILESNSFESASTEAKVNLDYIQLRKCHGKEIDSLIDIESDKEFFLKLLDSLNFLNKKLPNIHFNSSISVLLKEKAKQSNSIKIAFQRLTYFSKIRLEKEDLFSLNRKLINYLFFIPVSIANDQNSKAENISNILHLIIFPYSNLSNLENLSPRKKSSHTIPNYAFLLSKPSLENELAYFLESFRNFNYLRMSISPQLIPKFCFSNLSILTLNYIRYIRGFLGKRGELNNNGEKINEKLFRISNHLNYEGLSVTNLEIQTKIEEYHYNKIYMIDFSNLEEDYMNDLVNRLIIFSQIINLISPSLFYLNCNFDYGSILLKNSILIVNFQSREQIKENTSKSEQFIPVKLYNQIINNIREIMVFQNVTNCSFLAISPKLKQNLNFYEKTLSAKKNLPVDIEGLSKIEFKKYACQFNEEKLINEINIYFKKIGLNIARKECYLRNSDVVLNEVKKINLFLDERLLQKKKSQQILSNLETSTFFGRIFKFFLEKVERINILVENIDRSVAYNIVGFLYDEVFVEYSTDFFSFLDFSNSLIANLSIRSDEFLFFILCKIFYSDFLKNIFENSYVKNLENCLNLHDLSENSFETFYIILEILLDLDNLREFPIKFLEFLLNIFLKMEEKLEKEGNYSIYAKVLWGAIFLPFYQNIKNDENQLITIKKMKIKNILFANFENPDYFLIDDATKLVKHFLLELKALIETVKKETNEKVISKHFKSFRFHKSSFLNFERIIISNKNLLIFLRAIKNATTLEELSNFLNFSINVSKYEQFLSKNSNSFLEIDLITNIEDNQDNLMDLFKKENLTNSHFLTKIKKINSDVRFMNDHEIINRKKNFKKLIFQKINDNFLNLRNIYYSIYNFIDFGKIDKKISYLRELVEYVEIFLEKNRFSRSNEDIEYLIEKVQKHEDQITSYINLCFNTFKDFQILFK